MKIFSLVALSASVVFASGSAMAQPPSANDPAPGYKSLLKADYRGAEQEIRATDVSKYDPARAINLGVALAKTGRHDQAAKQFKRVLFSNDEQVVVANGDVVSSHDLAARALEALQSGQLSR